MAVGLDPVKLLAGGGDTIMDDPGRCRIDDMIGISLNDRQPTGDAGIHTVLAKLDAARVDILFCRQMRLWVNHPR